MTTSDSDSFLNASFRAGFQTEMAASDSVLDCLNDLSKAEKAYELLPNEENMKELASAHKKCRHHNVGPYAEGGFLFEFQKATRSKYSGRAKDVIKSNLTPKVANFFKRIGEIKFEIILNKTYSEEQLAEVRGLISEAEKILDAELSQEA